MNRLEEYLENEGIHNSQISDSHKAPQGRLVRVLEKAKIKALIVEREDNRSAPAFKTPSETKAQELFRILEKELDLAQPQDKALLMRNFLTACVDLDRNGMPVELVQNVSRRVKEIGFGKAKKKERAAADKKLYQDFTDKFGDISS